MSTLASDKVFRSSSSTQYQTGRDLQVTSNGPFWSTTQ
jgi:hypothetical protein